MSWKQQVKIELKECISCLDFTKSQENDFLAAGLIDEKVFMFKNNGVGEYEDYWKFEGNTLGVVDVKFNPQADSLAVSSLDSNVRVFNFSQKQKIAEITCSPMECWKLTFDNSGKEIITCGELGVVKYYDIETSENNTKLNTVEAFATSIAISPNDRWLAVGNIMGSVFLFDLKAEKKCHRFDLHGKQVRQVTFTRDSARLLICSDDLLINILDLVKLQPTLTLSGHEGNINCVDSHPFDPKFFVSCSYDKTIRFWDLNQKQCIQTISDNFENIWAVKFSQNGKVVASGYSFQRICNIYQLGAENGDLQLYQI